MKALTCQDTLITYTNSINHLLFPPFLRTNNGRSKRNTASLLPIPSVRTKLAKTTIDTKRWNICMYSFHPRASAPETTGNKGGAAN